MLAITEFSCIFNNASALNHLRFEISRFHRIWILIFSFKDILTFGGCGGAGVIVTDGDRSFTPAGNPEGGLPKELL